MTWCTTQGLAQPTWRDNLGLFEGDLTAVLPPILFRGGLEVVLEVARGITLPGRNVYLRPSLSTVRREDVRICEGLTKDLQVSGLSSVGLSMSESHLPHRLDWLTPSGLMIVHGTEEIEAGHGIR